MIASGVGYHLDNMGRWLIERAPAIGGAYASLLAPGPPRIGRRPGWRFAEEYYDQRRWMACRRGALWEAAAKSNSPVSLPLAWLEGTLVDVALGNDNSLCLYVCGSFEPNEFAFLARILTPGMVFVDVGANDGYYSLFAARRVGSSGLVVAFEPSSRERANLEHNLAKNGCDNVRVVAAALGAAPGTAELKLAHPHHSGHNTLGTFVHDDVCEASVERVTVETLDRIAAEQGLAQIDMVKIDVEGAEASVIRGASAVLGKMRPLLMLEVNERAMWAQGADIGDLLDVLTGDFGYRIFVFSPTTGHVVPMTDRMALSSNIVAVPAEKECQLPAE